MFTIEIAGIPIGIDNHFSMVEELCKDYLSDKQPQFTVSASEEEMKREDEFRPAYAEWLCVYRQIALTILKYDAFLMHAAVIDVDGQGVAFTAKSGTGKTTRVLLWKKAMGDRIKIVNGDKPILRFINDTLYAFGTPWMGKENFGANICVPLKYICFVERSQDVSLEKLETDEIIPRLFQQILVPKDPMQLARFLPLIERFIKSVPFFLLKCNREKEKPAELWEQMKNTS